MGLFSHKKKREDDGPTSAKIVKNRKDVQALQDPRNVLPVEPKWKDAWSRTQVEPEEVQELLRGCTAELKSRG